MSTPVARAADRAALGHRYARRAPGLAAGVPHVLAHGPLQRAQSLACYADPNEAASPTPLLRLDGRLFGGGFDRSLPLRGRWHSHGRLGAMPAAFPSVCVGSRTASSVARSPRHRSVLASGADVYGSSARQLARRSRCTTATGSGPRRAATVSSRVATACALRHIS